MARVQLNKVDYIGGHPSYPDPLKGLVLVVDDEGIHVRRVRQLFVMTWNGIVELAVEGPEQAERRFTATRLVALGPLGLAAKKTTSNAYLHVATGGYTTGFQVPKTSAGQLRAQLARWSQRITPRLATPQPDPAVVPPTPQGPPAAFYPDPQGVAAQRWWDGTRWTEHVQQ